MRLPVLVANTILFFISFQRSDVEGYKILGFFPYPGASHFRLVDPLMIELARRGHNVTVYSTFPKDKKLPNHTDVSVRGCFNLPTNMLTMDQMTKINHIEMYTTLFESWIPKEEEVLTCEPLVRLRDTREPFDLIITEGFGSDFGQFFGYHLEAFVINFHTTVPFPWMYDQTGLPSNPSYIPHIFAEALPPQMSFTERLKNTLYYLYIRYLFKIHSENLNDEIATKFFHKSVPPLANVVKNASLMFTATHISLNRARPIVPNVIEVAGLNIRPAERLPQEIETFINKSTHGVVYFCMGSLLRGESFPEKKRDAFLHAFAKLPQRVLWKWESDYLPGKSENIMTSKWMPQRDILAHPNVKLFISHGGLLGTSEAVYEGVPILGIPIFGDQKTNLEIIVASKAGDMLDYDEITEETVFEKISRLLNNTEYKKNSMDLSIRYKDRPMSALDTAVYWTEYVIRHKGAHHLKTGAVHMPWYQFLLIDVIAFSASVVLSVVAIGYQSLKTIYRYFTQLAKHKTN